jgi:hypothetical protein
MKLEPRESLLRLLQEKNKISDISVEGAEIAFDFCLASGIKHINVVMPAELIRDSPTYQPYLRAKREEWVLSSCYEALLEEGDNEELFNLFHERCYFVCPWCGDCSGPYLDGTEHPYIKVDDLTKICFGCGIKEVARIGRIKEVAKQKGGIWQKLGKLLRLKNCRKEKQ